MARRSHGTSNTHLVQELKRNGVIKSDIVAKTMTSVDRKNFCPTNSYQDAPQPIGFSTTISTTISAPHMHAHTLERLKDKLVPGAKVLDVGSGSGYLTLCMALMVGDSGVVVGIDHIKELITLANKNIQTDKPELADTRSLKLVVGDGCLGHAKEAPYDLIHVGAAAPTVPKALLAQLKNGGRLLIPVGPKDGEQHLTQIEKSADGTITTTKIMAVKYASLFITEYPEPSEDDDTPVVTENVKPVPQTRAPLPPTSTSSDPVPSTSGINSNSSQETRQQINIRPGVANLVQNNDDKVHEAYFFLMTLAKPLGLLDEERRYECMHKIVTIINNTVREQRAQQ